MNHATRESPHVASSSIPPRRGNVLRAVRVCFVIDNLDIGGTESQLLSLINGLHRDKVRPFLCILNGTADRSRVLEPGDCDLLRLGVLSLARPSTLYKAWRFTRFIRRHQIDIVQTFFSDSTYFAVPLARLAGTRHIVLTRRNIGHSIRPLDRVLMRLCQRQSQAVIANCDACRRAVVEQEHVGADKVHVISNGIDLNRFESVPPFAPAAVGGPRRVGMVGNLRPIKGADVFVRAAAIVARDVPGVTFRIAGGGKQESIQQLAESCGLANRLVIEGTVHDIPSFLSTLDVAVLPSRAEGLSNALLEYMAAGRPIVATRVGGNVELIHDGVTGWLVAPGDENALAAAIRCLLESPEVSARLACAAKTYATANFSLDMMCRRHELFYSRMVQAI